MNFKWRKWNRVVHRDFGYLFFGMTLIYAISGIAINHIKDWNPNYVVTAEEIQVETINSKPDKTIILSWLDDIGESDAYKSHYFPDETFLKVFIDGGTVYFNLETGEGLIEKTTRRPLFREVNYLHYNPIKYWTWFSDIYAGGLIVLALSGLFIPRGETGITGRAAWMAILGILIPLVYLFIYFY
ncbi:MAG: PepSY-associated TM helix domain-containing protein [Bacteroidetes bacterium]|nr:PepSY-associated TM helix domain-containing protein [Bacteroidota bacterium]